MNDKRLMRVLLAPHVSEKSTHIAENNNQIAFKVAGNAKKIEIKQAVELLFNVEVKSVSVANVKGKKKRFGLIQGRRQNWKKAYVTLQSGHDIDFLGVE
jgi:large subunit ribosomal protein L23